MGSKKFFKGKIKPALFLGALGLAAIFPSGKLSYFYIWNKLTGGENVGKHLKVKPEKKDISKLYKSCVRSRSKEKLIKCLNDEYLESLVQYSFNALNTENPVLKKILKETDFAWMNYNPAIGGATHTLFDVILINRSGNFKFEGFVEVMFHEFLHDYTRKGNLKSELEDIADSIIKKVEKFNINTKQKDEHFDQINYYALFDLYGTNFESKSFETGEFFSRTLHLLAYNGENIPKEYMDIAMGDILKKNELGNYYLTLKDADNRVLDHYELDKSGHVIKKCSENYNDELNCVGKVYAENEKYVIRYLFNQSKDKTEENQRLLDIKKYSKDGTKLLFEIKRFEGNDNTIKFIIGDQKKSKIIEEKKPKKFDFIKEKDKLIYMAMMHHYNNYPEDQ